MEFFDKLGKKASEAYKVTADKTGKIAKEAKLRMKMGDIKSEINDIYEEIGKKVYENHVREEKEDISKDLEEKCTKIDCLSDEIESLLKECLELKDKKQCPKCYTEIDKNVKFCPQCGEKQEVEEAKEVEVIEHETNNAENNNTENSSDNQENKNKENNSEEDSTNQEKTNLERTVEIEADVDENHDETVEYLEVEDDEQ